LLSDRSEEEAANDLLPKSDKKKKRRKKTPAKKQKEENAKHFEELLEEKRDAEGEEYELPKPVKPERQEHKPSQPEGAEESAGPNNHNFDFNETPSPAEASEDGKKGAESEPDSDDSSAGQKEPN
jgi:hypothetical protein